jgi:hypothetical protein
MKELLNRNRLAEVCQDSLPIGPAQVFKNHRRGLSVMPDHDRADLDYVLLISAVHKQSQIQASTVRNLHSAQERKANFAQINGRAQFEVVADSVHHVEMDRLTRTIAAFAAHKPGEKS